MHTATERMALYKVEVTAPEVLTESLPVELTWNLATTSQPGTLYVEGLAVSDTLADQLLRASYDWCIHMEDTVRATVEPRSGESAAALKLFTVARDQGGNEILGREKYDPHWRQGIRGAGGQGGTGGEG